MGGAVAAYVRPVQPTNGRISSYDAHKKRTPTPSKEPGVDYYCPIGTPLVSIGDGKVLEVGGGITPATGRFIWVGLDDGRSFRFLHLKEWRKKVGDRVRKGDVIAISGASGYGSEFFGFASVAQIPASYGGPHVHATLFPAWSKNFAATLDLEMYVDLSATAGGQTTAIPKEWDEMASKDEIKDAVREVIAERTGGPVSIIPLVDTGGIYLFSPLTGRRAHIGSPYHVNLIQRAIDNNSNDNMLSAELDIVAAYLTAVNPPAGVNVDTDALAQRLAEIVEGADAEAVSAAVKSAIAASTSVIADAVVDGLARELTN